MQYIIKVVITVLGLGMTMLAFAAGYNSESQKKGFLLETEDNWRGENRMQKNARHRDAKIRNATNTKQEVIQPEKLVQGSTKDESEKLIQKSSKDEPEKLAQENPKDEPEKLTQESNKDESEKLTQENTKDEPEKLAQKSSENETGEKGFVFHFPFGEKNKSNGEISRNRMGGGV